jgi:FkbM family methyltransferase
MAVNVSKGGKKRMNVSRLDSGYKPSTISLLFCKSRKFMELRKFLTGATLLTVAIVLSLWLSGLYPSSSSSYPPDPTLIAARDRELCKPQQQQRHVNDFLPYLKNIHEWQKRGIVKLRTVDGMPLNAIISSNIKAFINAKTWWDTYSQGGWEPQTFTVFRRFINPHSVVVDFGAWIGVTAMYAGLLSQNVYALEPDPVAYEAMAANLYVNPYLHDRVNIDHGCIAMETQPMEFFLLGGGGSSGSSLTKGSGKSVMVDCFTLEDWAHGKGISQIDFIKMDTEGAEELLIPQIQSYILSLPHVPHLWLSVHVPYWTDISNTKAAFVTALKNMYPTCYLEATQTLLDYSNFDAFLYNCEFCTLMCTRMPFADIPWDIDLSRKNQGRIFEEV